MVGYLTKNSRSTLHEVLMFKGKFEVSSGLENTGYNEGIRIITNKRDFVFLAENIFQRNEWVEAIN